MVGRRMDGLATVEMSLVLALAAGVALVLLVGVAAVVLRGATGRLADLHRLAADGLLGQARAHVPQPLAGSPFETLVQALDRGDADKARGAYRRLLRGLGRFHLTGWLPLALFAPLLAGLPLAPVTLLVAGAPLGWGGGLAGNWAGLVAACLATAALLPLALTASTLGFHLHSLEQGRRASAAAALLQHAGKELR